MTGHFKNVCKHGEVFGQCRCPAPDKTVNVVECPPDHEEKYKSEEKKMPEMTAEWTLASVVAAAAHAAQVEVSDIDKDDQYEKGRDDGYRAAMADVVKAVMMFEAKRAQYNSEL